MSSANNLQHQYNVIQKRLRLITEYVNNMTISHHICVEDKVDNLEFANEQLELFMESIALYDK